MNAALEKHTPTSLSEPVDQSVVNLSPDQMAYQLIRAGADFQSVREMVLLTKEIAAEKARNAFNEAVSMAKADIPVIEKNAEGHNKRMYANFAAYASVIDPIIAKHGLRYRFTTEQTDRITVTCVLSHKDGHSEENSLSGPADNSGSKNAIQAIGSTLTYLQRYTLIQAFGLAASGDDDGQLHGAKEMSGPISIEQLTKLRELIDTAGVDIEICCENWKIEALPDLPASEFDRRYRDLESWWKRQQSNGGVK